MDYVAEWGQETRPSTNSASNTDAFHGEVSEISGKAIRKRSRMERGRLIMADSQAHLHSKKYAIWGDPDFVQAMAVRHGDQRRPTHCLATNGTKRWESG